MCRSKTAFQSSTQLHRRHREVRRQSHQQQIRPSFQKTSHIHARHPRPRDKNRYIELFWRSRHRTQELQRIICENFDRYVHLVLRSSLQIFLNVAGEGIRWGAERIPDRHVPLRGVRAKLEEAGEPLSGGPFSPALHFHRPQLRRAPQADSGISSPI